VRRPPPPRQRPVEIVAREPREHRTRAGFGGRAEIGDLERAREVAAAAEKQPGLQAEECDRDGGAHRGAQHEARIGVQTARDVEREDRLAAPFNAATAAARSPRARGRRRCRAARRRARPVVTSDRVGPRVVRFDGNAGGAAIARRTRRVALSRSVGTSATTAASRPAARASRANA